MITHCSEASEHILDADDPRRGPAPAGLREHLAECAACRALADRLASAERTWRDAPAPQRPGAERRKAEFLARLAAGRTESAGTSRRGFLRWTAAAAVVGLAVGVGTWMIPGGTPSARADDLVEQMIEWNLELADAPSGDRRARLHAEQAETFRRSLAGADLAPADQRLAERLLANGEWLAGNSDPVAEAERFDGLADDLMQRMQTAAPTADAPAAHRLARQYGRIAHHALDRSLERAEASGALDFDNARRVEKTLLRDAQRREQLAAFLEKTPNATRKEIRRVLDLDGPRPPKGKPFRPGKGPAHKAKNGKADPGR